MRELIRSVEAAETAYQAADDQGVIDALNAATIKVKHQYPDDPDQRPGYVSNATMGAELGQAAVAGFIAAADGAADYHESLATPEGSATAKLIQSFLARMNTTPQGIDFANEEMRGQLSAILTGAGIDPAPYLALGYTLLSPAEQRFERPVTLDDLPPARGSDALDAIYERGNRATEAAATAYRAGATVAEIDAAAEAEWSGE